MIHFNMSEKRNTYCENCAYQWNFTSSNDTQSKESHYDNSPGIKFILVT